MNPDTEYQKTHTVFPFIKQAFDFKTRLPYVLAANYKYTVF